MYICFCSSYDFVAPFSLETSTDRTFDMGTQSLVAGRNGILELDFQKNDPLKVKCLYTPTHTHTHTHNVSFKMKTLRFPYTIYSYVGYNNYKKHRFFS